MAIAILNGEKFRIVSQPATESWCGDCDDDTPTDGTDPTNCENQEGSAMVVLVGAEEDGSFAMCRYHLNHWKKEGAIVE